MCQTSQPEALQKSPPKSPWRRFFRQPVKPKLCRKVASGAKINLNRYWSKFEEVTSVRRPHALLMAAPLAATPGTCVTDDNAINDNLINERTEIGNFTQLNNY